MSLLEEAHVEDHLGPTLQGEALGVRRRGGGVLEALDAEGDVRASDRGDVVLPGRGEVHALGAATGRDVEGRGRTTDGAELRPHATGDVRGRVSEPDAVD